jgi:RNA polymerase sigma-70 factor (ECF subfamily)
VKATPLESTATVHAEGLSVGALYDREADFVFRTLHRLGVREADLPDLVQEVFVVVHRRRAEYVEGRSIRPWLYGIALGLARNHRRKAGRQGESLTSDPPERIGTSVPDDELEARRRRERGERLLAALDPEQRAVFVMFEIEGLSGAAIAEDLGVPIGTVHSRLFAARRELAAGLSKSEGE